MSRGVPYAKPPPSTKTSTSLHAGGRVADDDADVGDGTQVSATQTFDRPQRPHVLLGARLRRPPAGRGYAGSRWGSASLERSWITALVWIWHTRLSVMPRMPPISPRVRPS